MRSLIWPRSDVDPGAETMALLLFSLFRFLCLAALQRDAAALTRHDFPDGFIFGAGTSAYQVHTSLCIVAVNVKTLISWIGWMP
jgi:hypothetical protein